MFQYEIGDVIGNVPDDTAEVSHTHTLSFSHTHTHTLSLSLSLSHTYTLFGDVPDETAEVARMSAATDSRYGIIGGRDWGT